MRNHKIKRFTYLTLFITIELVITMVPFLGFIPLGAINATTMHIPVILAGILVGKKEGAIVGFVFGFISLLKNTFSPTATSFVFSPFIEIAGVHGGLPALLIVFVPRILIGYCSGAIFNGLTKLKCNESISIGISAIIGSLVNTFLVMAGIYLFFGNAYANAMNISFSALISFIIGVIATNGIAEAIIAAAFCVAIGKAAKKIIRF